MFTFLYKLLDLVWDDGTVMIRREDDGVSFSRSDDDYIDGFGDAAIGSYWHGLLGIRAISRYCPASLRMELQDTEGRSWFAYIPKFSSGISRNNYEAGSSGGILNTFGTPTLNDSYHCNAFPRRKTEFSFFQTSGPITPGTIRHDVGWWWRDGGSSLTVEFHELQCIIDPSRLQKLEVVLLSRDLTRC